MVSIHGPLGYGPSTLPLRQSAATIFESESVFIYWCNLHETVLESCAVYSSNLVKIWPENKYCAGISYPTVSDAWLRMIKKDKRKKRKKRNYSIIGTHPLFKLQLVATDTKQGKGFKNGPLWLIEDNVWETIITPILNEQFYLPPVVIEFHLAQAGQSSMNRYRLHS